MTNELKISEEKRKAEREQNRKVGQSARDTISTIITHGFLFYYNMHFMFMSCHSQGVSEEKLLKKLQRKQEKKEQLEDQKRRQDEFTTALMAQQKKQNKKKKAATPSTAITELAAQMRSASANNAASLAGPGTKRSRKDVEADKRNVLTAKRQNDTKENTSPLSQKPKRLAMMRSHEKHGFTETPMTPPRKVRFDFLEETRLATPRHNVVMQPARKRKSGEYNQPSNLLQKPRWMEETPSPISKRTKIDVANDEPTGGIRVQRLGGAKKKKNKTNAIPAELANFRNAHLYQAGVSRVNSVDLGLQKAGADALRRFKLSNQS